VDGFDERNLVPYLFNAETGTFDTPVPASDILERNTIQNYIRFRIQHFSTYGLAVKTGAAAQVPLGHVAVPLMVLLTAVAVAALWRYRRGEPC